MGAVVAAVDGLGAGGVDVPALAAVQVAPVGGEEEVVPAELDELVPAQIRMLFGAEQIHLGDVDVKAVIVRKQLQLQMAKKIPSVVPLRIQGENRRILAELDDLLATVSRTNSAKNSFIP